MKKIFTLVFIIILLVIASLIVLNKNKKKAIPYELSNNVELNDNLNNDFNEDNSTNNIDVQSGEKTIYNDDDFSDKVLYFYDGCLVGYSEYGIIYMDTDVTLKDIFDNKMYTVYSYEGEKIKSKKLGITNENQEDNSSSYSMINLPNKFNDDLSESYTIPQYVEFFDDNNQKLDSLLAFNRDYDVNFAPKLEITSLPDDVQLFVENVLEKNGVNGNTPYVVSEYYNVDLNNNGSKDEVFSIISNGSFSLLLSKIDNYISIIDADFDVLKSVDNYYVSVVDLNDDGIYEIIYKCSEGDKTKYIYLATYLTFEYRTMDSYKKPKESYSITIKNEEMDYEEYLYLYADKKNSIIIDNGWGPEDVGYYTIKDNEIICEIKTVYSEPSATESLIDSGTLVLRKINNNTVKIEKITPWIPKDKNLKEDVACFEEGMVLNVTNE